MKMYVKRDSFKNPLQARIELEDPKLEIGRLQTAIWHMVSDLQNRLQAYEESDQREAARTIKLYEAELEVYEKMYSALHLQSELPWPEGEPGKE
ncbi:hypothetical protein LLE49_27140 [Alicyclobacillus tolerans]|uniref:hypothetical protein n=1 Tax=Alicyclobacillus tolerans TaxID=90970 RepID=UPI001F294382|nr:hypothetical protein [Alicyclobacillus tolerans]MCF8568398.1 hypothetical protein [Alicyclobacillus tolerans]